MRQKREEGKMKYGIYTLIIALFLVSTTCFAQEPIKQEAKESREKNNSDKWFAMDKLLHFTASAGITGLSYHCYHCQFNNPEDKSIYFSLSIAGVSGIGKELFDKKIRKTRWSWKDITADIVGVTAGYFLFIKLKK